MSGAEYTGADDINGIVRESFELDRELDGFEDVVRLFKQVSHQPMEMIAKEEGNGADPEKRTRRQYTSSLNGITDFLQLASYRHPSSIEAKLRPNETRPEEPNNEKYQLKLSVTAVRDPTSTKLKSYDQVPTNSKERASVLEEANIESTDRKVSYWVRNLGEEAAMRAQGIAPQIENIGRNTMTIEEINNLLDESRGQNSLVVEERSQNYTRGRVNPGKLADHLEENYDLEERPSGEFRIHEARHQDNNAKIEVSLQIGDEYNPELSVEGHVIGDHQRIIRSWERELDQVEGTQTLNVYGVRV